MSSSGGWPSRPLGELVDNFDSVRVPVKAADRRPGPYPYYGASGIVDHVDDYLFDGEYLLVAEDGENLRTRKTPVAFLARGKFWVNNHAHILRANQHADTRYLAYALSRAHVGAYLTGSTQPKLTQGALHRIPVPAPPVAEQCRIADTLGALDDKIELNRRINHTLETLARAIFTFWFVDFDPVRLKMDGRDAGLPSDLVPIFPSDLQPSSIGMVPRGWSVASIGDVASELEAGSRPKGGVFGIRLGVPSIGAESVTGIGKFDFSKTKRVPESFCGGMKRGKVKDRDVLIYKDGGRPGLFEPHVTLVGEGFPFDECCINEHVYRLRVSQNLSQSYAYFWLTSELASAEMRERGTGVAIPSLNSSALRSVPVLVPGARVVREFTQLVDPIVTSILHRASECRVLESIRETLLPKLMLGEVAAS